MRPSHVRLPFLAWIGLAALAGLGACVRRPTSFDASPSVPAAVRVSMDTLIGQLPPDSSVVCVAMWSPRSMRTVSADRTFLRQLAPRARRVVPRDACPASYDFMLVAVDSAGRAIPPRTPPPGHREPYTVSAEHWHTAADTVRLRMTVQRGLGGRIYECVVIGEPAKTARCTSSASFAH